MAKERSFENAVKLLWQIEKEEDLLNWRIAGVNYWVEFRSKFYYNFLLKELGLIQTGNAEKAENLESFRATENQINTYWRHLNSFKSLLHRRKTSGKARRAAVLPFRRRNINGIDPLTAELVTLLPQSTLVMGIGRNDLSNSEKLHFDRMKTFFYDRYKLAAFVLLKFAISKKDRAKLARVLSRFEKEFDIKLSKVPHLFEWYLRRFICERWGFRRFFKHEGITELYVVSADRPSMIAAAHDVGAKVIELQHGWMSETHIRYAWPNTEFVPYFPDEFWAWGKYWVEGTPLPQNCKIEIMGANRTFNDKRSNPSQEAPNTVIVISQPFCSAAIAEQTIHCAKELSDFNFVIKPHPTESKKEILRIIQNAGLSGNIRVADADENTLDLISSAEYCFGVNSTSLFEALALGKKLILFDIPGWESLSDVISRGDAVHIGAGIPLRDLIATSKPAGDPNHYYGATGNRLHQLVAQNT